MSAADTFAALGDATRLHVVSRLAREGPLSITALSEGVDITRQAVTKHLEVLAGAGVVRSQWRGRERLWELRARELAEARRTLDAISARWDKSLERLRAMVE
jgi:DNA-binding transcriptional ArsR family regulator